MNNLTLHANSNTDPLNNGDGLRASEIHLWWVDSNLNEPRGCLYDGLVHWLTGKDSPRQENETWRLHSIDRKWLIRSKNPLPLLAGSRRSVLIWAIEESGIAEAMSAIQKTRQVRSGYRHLTAGLISPVEQMVLGELGVVGSIQYAEDWKRHRRLFVGPHCFGSMRS